MEKKRFDYSWVVIATSFVVVMFTLGFANGTKGLFLGPVSEALGVQRSVYSFTESIRFITTAIANVFFGTLVAKFGPKKLIGAGCLALAGAMFIYSASTSIFVTYIGGFLLGIGFGWTGTSMVGILINRWATKNKGTLMGLVMASSGLGNALAVQVISPIIEMDKENQSYRIAYLVSGIIIVVIFFLAVFLIKDAPKGLDISGETHKKKKSRGNDWVGIEFSELVRRPYFYVTLVLVFLTGLVLQGITGVATQSIKDTGMDATYVATIVSIHAITLFVAKFLVGVIYDKLGLRVTVSICYGVGSAVMVMLAFITNTPEGMILAAVYQVFSSVAIPLETIILPIYTSDFFGQKSYAKILGLVVACNVSGYAVGTPLVNLMYDIAGTYKYAMLASAGLMVVILAGIHILIGVARKEKKRILDAIEADEAAKAEEIASVETINLGGETIEIVESGSAAK